MKSNHDPIFVTSRHIAIIMYLSKSMPVQIFTQLITSDFTHTSEPSALKWSNACFLISPFIEPSSRCKHKRFHKSHWATNTAVTSKWPAVSEWASRAITWNKNCRYFRYSARMSSIRTIWEKMSTRCPRSFSRTSSLSRRISFPLLRIRCCRKYISV